ncbi:MAG: DUF4038 domain-containing protein [Saprospiraceae bacterium]|nr:DUF4038 domain-containing protein [Saprospiraceae bacterium]
MRTLRAAWPLKLFLGTLLLLQVRCAPDDILVPQWSVHEIVLTQASEIDNPYTDLEVTVRFLDDSGKEMIRPAFYDGDMTWKVRFTPPEADREWTWKSTCSDPTMKGLHGQEGHFHSVANPGSDATARSGLLQMSPGKRNVVRSDGSPFLVVGDTPWALPFRATKEQVWKYAADRQQKGFNTALLMSIQPDMDARGPEARDTELGFARGFSDLKDGHLRDIQPEYFQYLDTLVGILRDHEIVPVFQPVFHGYGWKGKRVLGNHIEPNEYVRYTKYLLARYGAAPAMCLIAGDNGGDDPGVREAGEMLEEWDAYDQPTGLHYNPCDDYVADWALDNPLKHCEHYNKSHQDARWLDFQWAQTGHGDEHLYHKVERMYDNLPVKASANGEPTYEGMNNGQNGLGWWQGEEAWMQMMSGGTMGVVYGAACLWQWKVTPDEEGWPAWTDNGISWEEALHLGGSTFVGLVGKILAPYDLTDIKKSVLNNGQMALQKDGLLIAYVMEDSVLSVPKSFMGGKAQWINPKTGVSSPSETLTETTLQPPSVLPQVLLMIE